MASVDVFGCKRKADAISRLYLHNYVGVMEEDPGKDFQVILISFCDSENREEGLGAENYAEQDIFLTNSNRARWSLSNISTPKMGRPALFSL